MQDALLSATVRTFEDLSLMLPELEVTADQLDLPVTAMVGISFEGAFRGWLVLRVCGDILPELTAGMLGVDSVPPHSEQEDALGEVANVICGNFLPSLAGFKEVFEIAGPFVIGLRTFDKDGALPDPTAAIRIGVSEGTAEVLLYLDTESFMSSGLAQ